MDGITPDAFVNIEGIKHPSTQAKHNPYSPAVNNGNVRLFVLANNT